ncbi:PH domain-containing protein [Euzebya sp.]|uniref:PH domain-containing protein n=1 Tax=Euzebya sp. TaxID=1971409 RepID=UPI0035149C44
MARRADAGHRAAEPGADGDVLTVSTSRVIPVVIGVVGVAWTAPTVLDLIAGGRVHPLYTPANLLVGAVLLAFALRMAAVRVVLHPDRIAVRRLVTTRAWPWDEVRGVSLRADDGIPRLRVVLVDGTAVAVPAWALVARDADGDREPAGDALERFGAAHGVAVRVRRITDPRRPT